MLESRTKKYSDESNERVFRFTFYCDSCGRPFGPQPLDFTGGEIPPEPGEGLELWKLRWQREHAQAFARADSQAALFFYSCPGCGDWICGDCVVSEKLPSGEIRDRCRRCHGRGREKIRPLRMVGKNDKENLPPVTERITDESDAGGFRFTFYCDSCGAGYQTPEIPFSGAAPEKVSGDFTSAQTLVWQAEHDDAYERANRRALGCFSPCEVCGKMICQDCSGELAEDVICPDCRGKNGDTLNIRAEKM